MISNHSDVLKLNEGIVRFRVYIRCSDLRRNRPPIFWPILALGSVFSKFRKISSISRSYLFDIAVLFLKLARISWNSLEYFCSNDTKFCVSRQELSLSQFYHIMS